MSTLSTTNIKHPSSASNNIVLDSSGRVLQGHSSAVSDMKYGGSGGFGSRSYVYGANDGLANGIAVLNYDATATVPALLKLCSSRNDTPGNNTAVGNSGDKCAAIQFMGNDGTQFIDLARIDAETDGTVGTGSMPGRLMFNVTAAGGSVVTEQMRLDSSGNLKFNSGYGSVATAYGCRAWIIFDGTSASIGTGYGSANVSSVTDAGTGRYVVNFTNAMPDTNFSTLATCRHNEGTAPGFVSFARNDGYQRSTGATDELRVHTTSVTYDSNPVCVAVFR